ncbi:MAG: tRNA (adenosine(37)-N6)-threonylcarbamoyltransferase complex ATPase subunit type 1 TsaE [Candidatus Sericytochromatia bacterium]|nr:tRNA (adenosine(37)-N6)-threonylcarbamoyltransferase complex ATPase subunit type 1 TsaE [Candidatus Sericytochromatia bacterium]
MSDVCLMLAGAEETQALGAVLGRVARPGDILWLTGGLGAGKTTLTQGLACGLGVQDAVTSPTFALVHEYSGRLALRHIDLYRLEPEELAPLGPWEWFEDGAVVVVEWPERLGEAWPLDLQVCLSVEGESRMARLGPRSARGARWLDEAELSP